MKLSTQVYSNWSQGVVNSLRADELDINASPRGINSALVSVAKGKCIVGKRRGASLVLPSPLYEVDGTTLAEFTSLFQYNYYNATTRDLDPFFYATTESGRLYEIDTEAETATSISTTLFNAGTSHPIWAQLNNVAYVTDGEQQKKIVTIAGVPTIQKHGIVAPTKATSSALSDGDIFFDKVAGGAMAASTWRVAASFYNSNTGHESNLSDYFEVTLSLNDRIRLYWDTTPADTQVTHINIYLLKVGTMTVFARSTAMQYAIGTASPTYLGTGADVSTATLLTFAPEVLTNSIPSETIRGWIVHNSRLFGWDEQNIYWSDITELGPEPESFRPEAYLPVAPNDGTRITVCHRIDDNVLLIAKEGAIYGLYGVDPNSWELRLIDPSVGCVAPKSMSTVEGKSYWWSRLGPIQWDHQASPNPIGYRLLRETTSPEAIYYQNASGILSCPDPPQQKVLFAFPTADSPEENNVVIAYNYELDAWETSRWDAFDICSMSLMLDENGREYVYMGGCYGKLFKWWTADVDGIRLSLPQTSATSVIQSGSQLTIDVGAGHDYVVGQWVTVYGFDLIGTEIHGLEGVPLQIDSVTATEIIVDFTGSYASYTGSGWSVLCDFTLSGTVVSSTASTMTVAEGTNLDKEVNLIGQYLYTYRRGSGTYQRRRIVGVSNITLEFDVATPWLIEPDENYDWVLSGPFFEWDTKWDDYTVPFDQKRFMFCYVDAICDTGTTDVEVDVYTGGALANPQRSFELSISGTGAIFDESGFDESVFSSESISRLRRRIAKVEYSYRYRVRHYDNNRQLVLLRLGNQAHVLTDRRT